ncbi:MAG: alpha/beta hydrolase [Anaerolineales bacterium]
MLSHRSWMLLALSIFAASCAQPAQAPTPEPIVITPATLPTETLPSATPKPTVDSRPVEEGGCKETVGQMIQGELVDKELPRSLPYRVYLPPCASEARGQLPTLYLLHGLARTDAQWDELGADEVAQDLVVAERAPPFLIVMPWERRGLEYEQTIVDYLIPYIESEYGASPDRALRSIGGISRGAGWALRIGLQHPELFKAIGLHSPAVLPPDMFMLPDWIEAIPIEKMPELWIDIGDRDPLRFSLPELTALFDEAELPYILRSYPGEHTEAYWAEHVEDYLRWYVSGWLDRELDNRPQ